LFQEEKRRLEQILDLKAKNEGFFHAELKTEVCSFMRELAKDYQTHDRSSVETEVPVKGVGKVDVLCKIGDVTIAVECGNTDAKKVLCLAKRFDVVLHIPFCWTTKLVHLE
jgi:hypothetical protein